MVPNESHTVYATCLSCREFNTIYIQGQMGETYDNILDVDLFGFRIKGQTCQVCFQPLYLYGAEETKCANNMMYARIRHRTIYPEYNAHHPTNTGTFTWASNP